MSIRTFIRKPLVLPAAIILVVLIIIGAMQWNKAQADPQNVFWGMLDQSLSTGSVTVNATQETNGTSVTQTVQYATGVKPLSHSVTSLSQSNAKVIDEMIGTPNADYTRYDNVVTTATSASGKPLDFSHVLGVWAKSNKGNAATGNVGNVQFSQSVLGTGLPLGGVAVPIADLPAAQRAKLVTDIRTSKVYRVTFSNVKKTNKNGRLLYTYSTTVQPILYASMMKEFAQAVGIHDLDTLDPNSFSGQQQLQIQLTVDAYARRLVTAAIPNTSILQTYTAYDVPVNIAVPTKTITGDELQTRLTNLQK